MTRSSRRLPAAGLATAMLLIALGLPPAAAAHEGTAVGPYLVEIGWRAEPAFVGQPNAVQVTIRHHDGNVPITDLAAGALAVVVSTAGVDSPSLPLEPAFDAAEGTGPLGEYAAALVPTAPGDYTFHITGAIHDTAVGLTVTSGADTFDPVVGSGDLEFPAKLPSLGEVATRLDRIDARIEALQSAGPGSGALAAALAAADAAADAARTATDAADRALLVGAAIGGVGVLLAVVAVVLAMRAGRSGRGAA